MSDRRDSDIELLGPLDKVEELKARFAALRADAKAPPAKRKGRPSKLLKRIERERDAFYYGDGRRTRRPSDMGFAQLNVRVPFEVKEMVLVMARKRGCSMVDVVSEAIYLLHEQETGKEIT